MREGRRGGGGRESDDVGEGEKERSEDSLSRQRLWRRKKREGARVGTTPWLVGSFDLLPLRNGPSPPAAPLCEREPRVVSRSRTFAGRYPRLVSSVLSFPLRVRRTCTPLALFLLPSLVISHLRRRGVRHVRITPSTTTRSLIIRSFVLWSFSREPWNPSRDDGRLLSLP